MPTLTVDNCRFLNNTAYGAQSLYLNRMHEVHAFAGGAAIRVVQFSADISMPISPLSSLSSVTPIQMPPADKCLSSECSHEPVRVAITNSLFAWNGATGSGGALAVFYPVILAPVQSSSLTPVCKQNYSAFVRDGVVDESPRKSCSDITGAVTISNSCFLATGRLQLR